MGKNGQLFIVQDYIEYNSQDSTSVLFYSWHWIVYWQLSHGASNILFGLLFGACAECY